MKPTLALLALLSILPLPAQETPHDLSLVLLIGQSNMAGRGKVGPEDQQPIPGVFMLNKDRQWVPAIDPMHWDKPQAGVGPGRPFAQALVETRPGAQIGLIPAAVGNTSLRQWAPGGTLYTEALSRLREAQKSGRLIAILWHQGGADAGSEKSSSQYAAGWVAMMKQLREDINDPEVPIIAGELGRYLYHRSNGRSKYAEVINGQINRLPQKLAHVGVATSEGLVHRGDELHFNTESQHELGQRYALAFFKIEPSWVTAPSAVPQIEASAKAIPSAPPAKPTSSPAASPP